MPSLKRCILCRKSLTNSRAPQSFTNQVKQRWQDSAVLNRWEYSCGFTYMPEYPVLWDVFRPAFIEYVHVHVTAVIHLLLDWKLLSFLNSNYLHFFSFCNIVAIYIALCLCKTDTLSLVRFSNNRERHFGKGNKNQGIPGFTEVIASMYKLESLQRGIDLKAILSVDPQPVRFLGNFWFSTKTRSWYCFIFQVS